MKKKYPKACGRVGTPWEQSQAETLGDKEGLQRTLLPVYASIAWGREACCNNLSTDDVEQG